jgi:hypothetical protein
VVFDGLRYIVYDDETPTPNDLVTFTLDGGDSANRYCGQDITEYKWYDGAPSGTCGNLLNAQIATTAQHTVTDKSAGVPFTDYTYTLQVKALNDSNVEVPSCATVDVRASQNLPPKATIISTDPASLQATGDRKTIDLPDTDGDGEESVNISGKCEEAEVDDGVAGCAFSAPLPGVTFSNTICNPIPVLPPFASLINCSTTATVAASRGLDALLTATDTHGNTHVYTLNVEVRVPRRDVNVRAVCPGAFEVPLPTSNINCTLVAAAEDVLQTVTVRLRNDGDLPETFDVTLGDSAPATIGPSATFQVVALPTCLNLSTAACANANVTDVTFNWTPTEGGSHTLTATATLTGGEADTDPADNTRTRVVEVTSVNDNPTNAVNDTATTNQSTPVTINVLANDTDADNATLEVYDFTQPLNGSVVPNGNNLTFTPTGAFFGTTTFTYRALDPNPVGPNANQPSLSATVTVTVNPLSGPPAAPTGVTVALAGTRMVQVTWTDNAVNETRHELQRCRITFGFCSWGNVNINVPGVPPGTPSYTNTVPAAGLYRYRLKACNPDGCSAFATSVLITVP